MKRGNTFLIASTAKKDKTNEVRYTRVFATTEAQARDIFKSAYPNNNIKSVSVENECIGGGEIMVPEFALAQRIAFAAIKEISEDKDVSEETIYDIVDAAVGMIKVGLSKALCEH